ncbi:hypothetical protein R1sor_008545 [Riccia sorocarpa]|uniref:Trichome birefringence-like N-terminal domain-containing protein n=1 Tax=Riccia sorocarpa TaxID=122646 RepID=A0ABD3HZZ2_9MARC
MGWRANLWWGDAGPRCYLTVPVLFAALSFLWILDQTCIPAGTLRGEFYTTLFQSSYRDSPIGGPERWTASTLRNCDIFSGEWVYDENLPLYSSCKFAEPGFVCHRNGRPDLHYQRWRWRPRGCDLPEFEAHDMLNRLNGSRVVFVGDSMGRTQWESLCCMLLQAVADKSSAKLIHGPITKTATFLRVRFLSKNLTIDYYRSPFLVAGGRDLPPRSPKRVVATLKLDKMGRIGANWHKADILVINTGHWWTMTKTYRQGVYFEIGKQLTRGMKVDTALERAFRTVTSWVNDNVDFNRTQVFFRSYEPPHWSMAFSRLPLNASTYHKVYPQATFLREALELNHSPALLLNVTTLSSYRPDGHVFNYTRSSIPLDCAHWCLPGVPDTWNQVMYYSLLIRALVLWGPASVPEAKDPVCLSRKKW